MQLVLAHEVSSPSPDLLAVYLPGLDIAQHAILSPQAAGSASTMAARLTALRRYYVALDRLLAPVLQPQRDEIVFVVTEPGRIEGQGERLLGVSEPRPSRATARGRVTDVCRQFCTLLSADYRDSRTTLALMTDSFTERPGPLRGNFGFRRTAAARHGHPSSGDDRQVQGP